MAYNYLLRYGAWMFSRFDAVHNTQIHGLAISRTHAPGSLNLNTGDNIPNTLSHTNKMSNCVDALRMSGARHALRCALRVRHCYAPQFYVEKLFEFRNSPRQSTVNSVSDNELKEDQLFCSKYPIYM